MQAINNLDELLETLAKCSGQEFVKLATRLDLQAEDFEEYSFWDSESYTRNCVSRNEDYELILLCWEAGQETPVHCHNGEECWVYALQGNMEEIRYQSKSNSDHDIYESERGLMNEGSLAYMHDSMGYHSLHNNSSARAMTLHLYMKPIPSCRVYDDEKNQFIRKEMVYTTEQGKKL